MPRVFIPRIVTEDNALGGSKIEKSLRFNGNDTYLSRTPSSASNRRTWTWSAWIKKSKNATVQDLFSAYDGSAYNIIRIGSDDQLNFQSNSAQIKETSAVLRDTNAWYHIVVAVDTTSGTAADRVIIYINGSRQSLATDNSVSQNTDYAFNTTNAHTIGVYANGSSYNFDGYMAEINFVDGYQYDASYFGFTDGQTGMWMPERYEGTYGTNGFYLNFGNASSGDEYQKYTVPTASFTNDSDTLLLINNNESNGSTTFTDSSSNGYSISGTGSIAHSTAQAKFGSSSILFDGSDDSLSVGGNGTLYSEMTASSNKTYEAFMYLNADDYTYIMSISSNQRYLGFNMSVSNGRFGFNGNYPNPYNSVQGYVPALDIPIGRWFHVFIQRNADGTMSVGFDGKILTDSVAEGADVSASGTTGPLKIGSQHYYGSTHRYFYDGYMDEIRMSDTPRYSPLGGAGTVGQDYSGNNNNLTPKNFSLGGVVKDTPTNNFSTLNPLDIYGDGLAEEVSDGNLEANNTSGSYRVTGSTNYLTTGKWYWETKILNAGDSSLVGVTCSDYDAGSGARRAYNSNGKKYIGNGENYGATYTTNDIIGTALDLDNGTIIFYKNGSSQGVAFTDLLTAMVREGWTPMFNGYNDSKGSFNFGQDSSFSNTKLPQGYKDDFGRGDFYYSVPSGYQALCSANLPPNASSIIRPQKHFETLIYTGDGTATRSISGLEFKPDFIWIKNRGQTDWHIWGDSVRGFPQTIYSNRTEAEVNGAGSGEHGHIASAHDHGFIVKDDDGTVGGNCNANSETYVAWCWKGGGTAVSNSDGTITSSVSANTEAGFSVVTWTGSGADASVGHGLGKKPHVIFVKNRSAGDNWRVWWKNVTTSDAHALVLNDTTAVYTGSDKWYNSPNSNDTTTTTFGVSDDGSTNRSGESFVGYCWAEIPGYSKFGTYTGNGSSDGPYIHLGFRPAWTMIKSSSTTWNWVIQDTKRFDGFNSGATNRNLAANSNSAEPSSASFSGNEIDYLSNGFKLRSTAANTNASGGTYIYMAFAEQPGVTSFDTFPNAR